MKLLDASKNGDNVPELENVHSVLLHCNTCSNKYLQNSKLFHTFVPDKGFVQLIYIQPKALVQCKSTDSLFDYIEI